MGHLWRIGLAAASLALGPATALCGESSDRELARTYVAFFLESKDFDSAVRALHEHLRTDRLDAGAWNLLGLAYLGREQWAESSKCFEQAARVGSDEDRGIYLYNYADALARGGNLKHAQQALEEASRDPKIADSARSALAGLERHRPLPRLFLDEPPVWNLILAAGGGYDSNVLLISDIARASATSTGAASPYLNPSAELRYMKALRTGSLNGSFRGAYTWFSGDEAQAFNSLGSGLAVDWLGFPDPSSKITHSLGNQLDLNYINSDGMKFYNWGETLAWRPTLVHSQLHQTEISLAAGYQKFALADGASPDDDRTGPVATPAVTYRRFSGLNTLSAGARYERAFASGLNYRSNTYALPLGWTRRKLPWDLVGNLAVEAKILSYPTSANARKDRALDVKLTALRRLGKGSFGSFSYSFTRNSSNIESSRYSKHLIGVSFIHEIF